MNWLRQSAPGVSLSLSLYLSVYVGSNAVFILVIQTHHSQCLAQPTYFAGVDCAVFGSDIPHGLALSVLVTVEMLNALNR